MDDREHAGRVAIITGGGRGFGLAFGHALAARGAHVVLADVDGDAAEGGAAEVRSAGGDATAAACDVTDEEQVAMLVGSVAAQWGGIDVLINNAGLHSQAHNEPMAALGLAGVRRLLDVNVMGVVTCTLLAAPHMRGRPGAAVVNLSSCASYHCRTAYGASKLAVRGITATAAHELGPDGIRVNAIAPGLILTDTIRRELAGTTVASVRAQQVLDRDGEEQDVVDAMLHLCSDRSSFVTGETLRVGGGYALGL